MTFPNVLTIAGSDSGGGAGIQADLKTFSALGTFGASVITALTAQNTQTVTAIHDVPTDFIVAQIDAVFEDLDIAAVKIGMLSRPEIIDVVAAGLERHSARIVVVDPVMIAKSGAALLQPDAVSALIRRLLPMATVITPNLPEASALLGRSVTDDPDDMRAAAEALRAQGPQAVLLKGGHGKGPKSVDLLLTEAGEQRFEAPRIKTKNTHGTGCTLSSAVAALLARGASINEAVEGAKAFITSALQAADQLNVGSGHGPVHHFHEYWRP
ncbi:MAG: bifunctional hydroxymethylpyrimidine kinase/phosphomethylpyrimidine kinase [Myxococcota bacterium]